MHLSEDTYHRGKKVKIHSVAILQSIVFQHPVTDTGIQPVISQTSCHYRLRFCSFQLIITVLRLRSLLTLWPTSSQELYYHQRFTSLTIESWYTQRDPSPDKWHFWVLLTCMNDKRVCPPTFQRSSLLKKAYFTRHWISWACLLQGKMLGRKEHLVRVLFCLTSVCAPGARQEHLYYCVFNK